MVPVGGAHKRRCCLACVSKNTFLMHYDTEHTSLGPALFIAYTPASPSFWLEVGWKVSSKPANSMTLPAFSSCGSSKTNVLSTKVPLREQFRSVKVEWDGSQKIRQWHFEMLGRMIRLATSAGNCARTSDVMSMQSAAHPLRNSSVQVVFLVPTRPIVIDGLLMSKRMPSPTKLAITFSSGSGNSSIRSSSAMYGFKKLK
mmetsp:Transcript_45818/g.81880  ORF Transcript_45818/g.81880 Transcript_45818/m.81880 type:complete len:200 (-) Transcript_45818:86-685(-)